MLDRIVKAWLWMSATLLLLSISTVMLRHPRSLTDVLMGVQDVPVLVGLLAGALVLVLIPGLAGRLGDALNAAATRPLFQSLDPGRRAWFWAGGVAIACLLIAGVGVHIVQDDYALSADEFVARFGAAIHRHGDLLAPVTERWRAYLPALQPQYVRLAPNGAFWASSYLPVNSMLQALGDLAGVQGWVSPLLAAISVIALFGVAREMWPENPRRALGAVVLLATSSQFLIMAMTPYAMPAHLAFNLVWLWLFLRGGRWGHAGAIAVAFLACGLHQLIMHPLFAAPFVLQLWMERRWRAAILYTAAYAAIGLFWIDYWQMALQWSGPSALAAFSDGGVGLTAAGRGFAGQVAALLAPFDPAGIGLIAKNLIRLITWQNPLAPPLALLGLVAAIRAKGTMRSLALGLILTALALFAVMPYEGHGWGYRYFHGLLGSICLLAVWEWGRLTQGLDSANKATAGAAFVAMAATSLLVLFPIHAWQAHQWVHPYAAANAAIQSAPSQLVLVDDTDVWFGDDLVRNDPYLRRGPAVLYLEGLEPDQLQDLCSRYSITVFDRLDAARFGIRTAKPTRSDTTALARRAEIGRWSCGGIPVGRVQGPSSLPVAPG